MKITLVFLAVALAGTAGAAFAGEDSTDRWHGTGPAFYEVEGGLPVFAAGESEQPRKPAKDCRR